MGISNSYVKLPEGTTNNIGMDPSEQVSELLLFYQPTYKQSKKRAEQISKKSSWWNPSSSTRFRHIENVPSGNLT